MRHYIALLRGINVGGKTIKMGDLKTICESLGFSDVATYIQSGNILFNALNTDLSDIRRRIEEGIRNRTGLNVGVILREQSEWKRVMEENPWIEPERMSPLRDVEKMHVTFLDEEPLKELLQSLTPPKNAANDEFKVKGREIYLYCPDGYGRTVYSNHYFEKNLKLRATTRNWKTVAKLYEMAIS